MTYEEACAQLKEWSGQFVTDPDNPIAQVLAAIEAEHNCLTRRWKTWRNYAQDLWGICCKGNSKGRAIDIMHKDDYQRMKNWHKECAEADKEVHILRNTTTGSEIIGYPAGDVARGKSAERVEP